MAGSYSNPTGNPWIGVTRGWAQLPDSPIAGQENKWVYVTQASDIGEEIVYVEEATNIFGSTVAPSNATLIIG